MKQVICISWGTKYGAPYVNRLYAMVARNLTPPFSFTCFTDDPRGLQPGDPRRAAAAARRRRCRPAPRASGRRRGSGAPRSAISTGPVLFMDLDLVVVGPLDDFFSYGDPDEVILARNPNTPARAPRPDLALPLPGGQAPAAAGEVPRRPAGGRRRLPVRAALRHPRGARAASRFWPDPWVRHFRFHCARPLPLNFFLPPRLPPDARVVIFPGGLLPPHAIAGQWGGRYRPLPPAAHLRGLFAPDRPDPPLRYLRHYLRPAPWVAEAWRE